MPSVVDICNMALSRIGVRQTISAITDNNERSKACEQWYELSRNAVLEESVNWPFATARVDLALVKEDPNDLWSYSYRYPSNCARARYIEGGDVWDRNDFEIGHDDDGKLIFTNWEDPTLVFTKRVTDTTLFSQVFASCVAWKMAPELAMTLAENGALANRSHQFYLRELATAGAQALNEIHRPDPPQSSFITSRTQ